MEIVVYPYYFEYRVRAGKTYMYLYGKQENGQKVCVLHQYDPYFYADARNVRKEEFAQQLASLVVDVKPEPAKVVSWEEVEKELLGKKQPFWKIVVNVPKAVPLISKVLGSWGISCYEKDILFTHRYLRDNTITPMMQVKAEGIFTNHSKNIFQAETITKDVNKTSPPWKVLAIDIETYAKKKEINPQQNPILMVALYGIDAQQQEFKKVITWKQFPNKLDYLTIVEDEAALLEEMKKIIKEYNPDIITGYFSDVFDFPYIKTRAEKLNVKLDLGVDGSIIDVSARSGYREAESSITGILHIDVLKFIKNIFGKNLKTDSYSLDSVSDELLGHKKQVVNLDKLAEIWDQHPEQLEHYCEYNLHDARLTFKLCLLLLPDMIEFSQVIGIPLFDVIRMRFSRLVENYILKRAIEFNVLAPNKPGDAEIDRRMEESIEGAYVYEPKPGLYKDMAVFDFRSLYPTIITAHNIGPEGFRCACCQGKNNVPEKDDYWFCTSGKKFIPTILEDLIAKRAELKKQVKEAQQKGEDTKIIESRSYTFKLLANSFYGYLGFFGARWYCLECAASTTAYARNYIKETIAKAEKTGFSIVYADTDSCFLLLGTKTKHDTMLFMEEINKVLPGQMELELVGYYPRGIFVAQKGSEKGAKKRYALLSEKGDIKITGFEAVRRNSSVLAKEVQEHVLRYVLEDNVEKAFWYVRTIIKDLRKGMISTQKLVIKTQITRELANYASIGPHVIVARKLQAKGEQILPGTIVKYVITKGSGLIRERAELPEQVKDGQYDVDYYIDHQIIPAVGQIFTVLGYSEEGIFQESSQKGLGQFMK